MSAQTTTADVQRENWERYMAEELHLEQARVVQLQQDAAQWRVRWPNHCAACGGWGGNTFSQSHPYGSTSAAESLFDPCEAHERMESRHRCGQDGLNADAEGPCSACGWNYDDGLPG